jgi:predicted double-glycine peptidase
MGQAPGRPSFTGSVPLRPLYVYHTGGEPTGRINVAENTSFVASGKKLFSFLITVSGALAGALSLCGAAWAANSPPVVRSLLELRHRNVVIQKWDFSCGAAALATVLNGQHNDPVTERQIARAMIKRKEYIENPDLVTIRQGFSLLDLKRFVETRGYKGIGYGNMALEDLIQNAPAIVPVNSHGYNHFVVFRGRVNNRILLADPAWGNRSMPIDEFERMWIDFPGMGKTGFVVSTPSGAAAPGALAPNAHDVLSFH